MPYIQKRKYQRKTSGDRLTDESIFFLCHGLVIDGDPEPTKAQAKRLWTFHAKEICADYCAEYHGMMPHAYWVFDSPTPHRQGFHGVQENWESEYDWLKRHNLLEQVKKFGYVVPEQMPADNIDNL